MCSPWFLLDCWRFRPIDKTGREDFSSVSFYLLFDTVHLTCLLYFDFDPYKHTTHRFTFCYITIFISFLSFPQLWDKSTTKICRWAVLLWVESIKKIDWFWNENNIVVGDRWSGSHMACVLSVAKLLYIFSCSWIFLILNSPIRNRHSFVFC